MAEDIKNTDSQAEGVSDNQNQDADTQAEKKYTDADVNNISKKNSEKAVNKLLKELGITDREKAKSILQKAAQDEAANASQTGSDDNNAELANQLAAELAEKEQALLESVFLTERVNPAKVERAVRLIDLKDCRNDDGKFDRSKATEAVKALLKEWPELAPKADDTNVGFKIGSDGQQNLKGGTKPAQKAAPQKSWNRFN